jgi:dTDP-4-dehydrorhamnose 3,5-epimerase
MIKITKTKIKDCLIADNRIFDDNRGFFSEIYKFSDTSVFVPKQMNCSFSETGVFRGIHRTPYSKLVTCVKGSIYDICVDLRPDSETYNQYVAIELNDQSLNSIYIPSYCGHGFLALQDSIVVYLQDEEYMKEKDQAYCYKSFNINFPSSIKTISPKDLAACS